MTHQTGDPFSEATDCEPGKPIGAAQYQDSFYIIGVGASAGGLEAIRNLVMSIPKGWPHTLVIIQHIPANYKTMMPEILSRDTDMKVEIVEDGTEIEPSHIYLIPPKFNIVIRDVEAHLSERDPPQRRRFSFALVKPTPRPFPNLPINLFFHSLAEAAGDRSVAIVLSGTGSDGSLGVRNIKDHDGFVMIQSPTSAEFDGMPIAAIDTGMADLVSDPEAMVGELNRYFEMRQGGILDVDDLFEDEEETFQAILSMVQVEAEIDFGSYKEPTLKRRIARRMSLNGAEDLKAYETTLRNNLNEITILHRDFLVGVTNFFRDPAAWQILLEKVIPDIFEMGDVRDPVKVWSAGCSSGEEAFTIALILEEYIRRNNIERDYRIIATDVNEQAIEAAKASIFPESSLQEIPERYRDSAHIQSHEGTFEIRPHIRKKIIFTAHNVAEDTPFIDTNLIVCRNLMIYLGSQMQEKVLNSFSFSLMENGYLFLGTSESIFIDSKNFTPVADRTRIFRYTNPENIRPMNTTLASSAGTRSMPRLRRVLGPRSQGTDDTSELFKKMLGQFSTCIILVDEAGTVLETFGEHRRYLSVPNDSFSANVFDLVHPHIGRVFSVVLREAESGGTTEKLEQKFVDGEGHHLVDVFCERISWRKRSNVYSLTIKESSVVARPALIDTTSFLSDGPPPEAGDQTAYIAKLETDLTATQEMLTTSIEDLGITNEELQTLNEELMAANEELQANNEEVQSVNEELHTVNAENVAKIAQLEAAYVDIENLLNDPVVGKVLLDPKLRIRRFTTGINKYVDLQPHDVGRPLTNFVTSFLPGTIAMLLADAERSSETGAEFTHEVQTQDDEWAMVWIRPFKGSGESIEGAILTIIDVTEIKRLEEVTKLRDELQEHRDLLEGLLESEAAGYWDWRVDKGVEILSPRLKSMFGYEDHELNNTPAAWQDLVVSEDLPELLDNFKEHVKSKGIVPYNREIRVRHKNGSLVWVVRRGRVIEWAEDGSPQRVLGVHMDITELKERETDVFKRAEEIRRFAFVASHDLMQPLNSVSSGLGLLMDEVDSKSERFEETRTYVEHGIDRMRSRISGVFEYARLQDEGLDLANIDLKQVALACLNDINDLVERTGTKIEVQDLPRARATRDLISRVFYNLLTNAIKYGPADKTPHVVVSAEQADGMVTIRVADNGIGIAPESREKVFQLFHKLDAGKDRDGNGLGLALCELVIEKCGGSIWVEDNPDGGTIFVFTLLATA